MTSRKSRLSKQGARSGPAKGGEVDLGSPFALRSIECRGTGVDGSGEMRVSNLGNLWTEV